MHGESVAVNSSFHSNFDENGLLLSPRDRFICVPTLLSSPNISLLFNATLLKRLFKYGNKHIIDVLLEVYQLANLSSGNIVFDANHCALSVACRAGNVQIVESILDKCEVKPASNGDDNNDAGYTQGRLSRAPSTILVRINDYFSSVTGRKDEEFADVNVPLLLDQAMRYPVLRYEGATRRLQSLQCSVNDTNAVLSGLDSTASSRYNSSSTNPSNIPLILFLQNTTLITLINTCSYTAQMQSSTQTTLILYWMPCGLLRLYKVSTFELLM